MQYFCQDQTKTVIDGAVGRVEFGWTRRLARIMLAGLAVGVMAAAQATTPSMPTMLDPTTTQVATGANHSCALTTAGAVQCWGFNGSGQLGNNSTTDSPVPVPVSGLSSGVVAIAAGGFHTCALTTAGAVLCWGWNNRGQLGDNSTTNASVPVAVSGLSSDVVAIAAGNNHTCALTTAGAMQCWGWNSGGQLGNNSTTNSHVPTTVLFQLAIERGIITP